MKNSTLTKIFILAGALFFTMQTAKSQMDADSIAMGASYVNDVYYSMENGEISSVDSKNWDIGFTTSSFDMNIILNDGVSDMMAGTGVNLYTYPHGDTSSWNSVDTSDIDTWTPIFNSDEDWNWGAFAQNALGHPDYGWGVYNDINHNVIGDSIFIIQTTNGDYKKLWIEKLISIAITFQFKYADIDGSNEHSVELVAGDYNTKNFVYYNLTTNEIIDREPPKTDWDLMFTKWVVNQYLPANVQRATGVLQNKNIEVVELKNFDIEDTCYLDGVFSTNKNTIGYDWKYLNASWQYEIHDSTMYYVKNQNKALYKLDFTGFSGSASGGKVNFLKELVSPAAPTDAVIDDAANTFGWTPNPLYPNATDYEVITPNDTIACNTNPMVIGSGDFDAGEVYVRVIADAVTCRPFGLGLANDVAFTGIFEPKANQINFTVYPNPAVESLNIKLTNFNNSSATIQVYDLIGALVFEDVATNINNYTLSTINFANGMYTIKIQSDNKTGNKMFVVNN